MPDHENGDGASGSRALIPGNYGRLVLLLPGNHRHEFTLSKARIRIGRASTNDVVVQDSRVSRNHALLECDAAGCTVVDAGSPNGTWINGVRVERRLLKSGDVLEMGGRYSALRGGRA